MATTRPRSSPRARRSARVWLSAAAVALVTVCAFATVFGNGFVNYDDDRAIVHNPYLEPGTPARFAWMWTTVHLGHYQPLAWLSLAADRAIGGLNPAVFHLDSALWHAAAAALLFLFLLELLDLRRATASAPSGRALAAAAAGALFWSVHPLRVESVAWATERRDPISAVFLLLAALTYVRGASGDARHHARRLAAAWGFVLLSLLAKAWGMTFFLVLIALDFYPLRRLPFSTAAVADRRYRRVWAEKIPFVALGFAAAAVAWIAQRAQPDAMAPLAQWGPGSRVLQAAYGLWFYPAKTLWPTALAVVYPLPPDLRAPASWIAWLAVVVAAVVVVAARGRRFPALAVCAVAYAAIVAPVLGFAQSGPQLVADRYAYVSAIPFSALVAGVLLMLPERAWPWAKASSMAVLAAFGVVTWQQVGVWRDSATLWRHAIESGHDSYVARLDYGQALRSEGRLQEAIAEYRRALALRPDAGNAWYNLANSLKAAGDPAGAERAYLSAIAYLPRKAEAQVNLGNLYYNERRLPEAIAQYRAAVAAVANLPPEQVAPEPYLYLGMALSDAGDIDAAREPLLVALRYPATRARAEQELRRLTPR